MAVESLSQDFAAFDKKKAGRAPSECRPSMLAKLEHLRIVALYVFFAVACFSVPHLVHNVVVFIACCPMGEGRGSFKEHGSSLALCQTAL